ncbi:MAG: response regulator [Gammaproteobacteria bacterium]|nr:response regulator [Gammaproteobacteria bacterium]
MGTWAWDPRRDVVELDQRALDILGGELGADFSFATSVRKYLPPENAEQYQACVRRIMEPGSHENQFEVELNWRRPDGRSIWIQMTGQSHFDEEGGRRRVYLLTGTILDITERKRSEEALAEASRQKDRFLATLAHELRNPLAPLGYAAELLREDPPRELEWSRDVIERQVAHLTRLIDDLLDLSRINRDRLDVRRERIEIADVVQAAIDATRPVLAEASQRLDVSLPPEPVYLHGDLVRLTQVLTNLLKNAAKFSAGPGRVEVDVALEGPFVSIAVRDTGIGIPPEALPHVFEMFYQSDSSAARTHGGLGIGLYLVRRLVELHGGTVEARSGPERPGSELIVRLPVVPSTAAARDAGAAAGATQRFASTAPSARVLVVDDNKDSADALAKLLRGSGHDVDVRYDGASAVAAAESGRPDVILLDLGMPSFDGYEVCRRIRESSWGKPMRLVAVTGWGREEDRERTRTIGFDDHLVKPVTHAAIESLLRRGGERL